MTRGRAKEGVALVVSLAVRQCVMEWKEVSSRLMRVKVKFGRELWVFVCAYGPAGERDETEREAFWNDLDNCQFWSKCEYSVVRRSKRR